MKLYTTNNAAAYNTNLLLDNDFLSELLRDNEVLDEFLSIFNKTFFIIDPLTEFEFLRDVFLPKQRKLKKDFLGQSIFIQIYDDLENIIKLRENAMLLSIIYSHRGHNKNTKISLVDLFLGARCMLNSSSMCLITGNKKDFPSSVYDIVTVINIEQKDGNIKPYTVIIFNKSKFDECFKDMKKMEIR